MATVMVVNGEYYGEAEISDLLKGHEAMRKQLEVLTKKERAEDRVTRVRKEESDTYRKIRSLLVEIVREELDDCYEWQRR